VCALNCAQGMNSREGLRAAVIGLGRRFWGKEF
jgi:hypothetical protein